MNITKENCLVFVKSEDWKERKLVAELGYALEILVYDNDYRVRLAVAKHNNGFTLKHLIRDEFEIVRRYVAKQRYSLDTLIEDPHYSVRAEVGLQGYGLDELVYDEDWRVRAILALRGEGFDKTILENDENEYVRKAVMKYKSKHTQ